MLRPLEERKESYCLVGHSHGGSVIAWALIESVAKGRPLDHLKRWITVGTPFVALRKERFLFSRLTLPRRVVLVATLMLLMMFLFYLGGQLFEGTLLGTRQGQLLRLGFSGAMMSLPLIFFYTFLKILDCAPVLRIPAERCSRRRRSATASAGWRSTTTTTRPCRASGCCRA